ncbi:hypothetical protein OWM54_06235 [Myxococcus sp. MISCRS1]|uniref:hypothetical protein n=1 Tax=Myxococcus TaxID=32 RepID=UPI00227065F5|nr:hypothetical protein [Myxococcus sp. MISCRS1]MCY0996734.1 hypothetical protein [Myxococcus sp. MISCRS1]
MAWYIVTYDLSDRHQQVKDSLKAKGFSDKIPPRLGSWRESLPNTTLRVEGASADEVARRFKEAMPVDALSFKYGSPLKRLFVVEDGGDYYIGE